MNPERSFPRCMLESVFPLIIIAWRVFSQPIGSLWSDWVTIISIYWIFTAFVAETRAWKVGTAATMLFLLAIFVHGQFPLSLAVLGWSR